MCSCAEYRRRFLKAFTEFPATVSVARCSMQTLYYSVCVIVLLTLERRFDEMPLLSPKKSLAKAFVHICLL